MSDSSSSSDNEAVEGMPFSMHDLNISDLIFEDSSFARGAFGRMVKADYFGVTVCVKILKKQRKKELAKFVHREMAALKTLSHPNLIQFIGLAERGGNEICLVTEYISGGTLRKLLKDRSIAIPWNIRVQIAVDISSAMTYLHSRKIMHRDLKSKNLLVGDNWKIKICDFGFARSVHDKKKAAALTFCGTEEYMAPEVIFGMEYDERAEVYSYGLLLCEIMTRQKVEETVPRTSNTNYGLDHQEFTAHVPRDCPIEFLQLAFLCTEFEPKNRPEFREITQILREIKHNVSLSPALQAQTGPARSSSQILAQPAQVAPPSPPAYVAAIPAPFPTTTQAQAPLPPVPTTPVTPVSAVSVSQPPQLPPPPISLEEDLSRSLAEAQIAEKAQPPAEKQPSNGRVSAKPSSSSPPTALRHPAPAPFRRSPSAPVPMPVPGKPAPATSNAKDAPRTTAKDAPRTPAKGAARESPGPSKLKPPAPTYASTVVKQPAASAQPAKSARAEEILTKPVAPLTRTSSSTFPTPKPAAATPPTPQSTKPAAAKPPPTGPQRMPSQTKLFTSPPPSSPPSSSPSSSPSPSPTPPKPGVSVLPKVLPFPSPSTSPRDRPTSPVAKPAPPNRVGRPNLPDGVDKKKITIS